MYQELKKKWLGNKKENFKLIKSIIVSHKSQLLITSSFKIVEIVFSTEKSLITKSVNKESKRLLATKIWSQEI
jgi:hypothetical protein